MGSIPWRPGSSTSLNRPESNVTGVSWFSAEIGQKHVELMNELVTQTGLLAVLVNPNNQEGAFYEQSAQEAARTLGRQLLVTKAGTVSEIDAAFSTLGERRVVAVLIAQRSVLRRAIPAACWLAARHGLPIIASFRDMPAAGGLISYGNSTDRCLSTRRNSCWPHTQGAKPADLPIDRATKFELVINLGLPRHLASPCHLRCLCAPTR